MSNQEMPHVGCCSLINSVPDLLSTVVVNLLKPDVNQQFSRAGFNTWNFLSLSSPAVQTRTSYGVGRGRENFGR